MEVNYDWRKFQEIFSSESKVESTEDEPIYFIVDEENCVLSSYANGEDTSELLGLSVEEVSQKLENRDLVFLSKSQIDGWLGESQKELHYYLQTQQLKGRVLDYLKNSSNQICRTKRSRKMISEVLTSQHFLIQALEGWWSKVLPSSYAVYLSISGLKPKHMLVTLRKGQLEIFHEPELGSLGAKVTDSNAVVRYLSERYLLPVIGIFTCSEDWEQWSSSKDPWHQMTRSIRAKRTKIFPFSFRLGVLIRIRAFLSI